MSEVSLRDFLGFKWDDDFQDQPHPPHTKRAKTRFKAVTDDEITKLSTVQRPKNTEYSTKWALKNFTEWRNARNTNNPDAQVPVTLIEDGDPEELNKWLSFYVAETRNTKGAPYPPKTLYQLMCGLLRYMRSINPSAPDFLNKDDIRFSGLLTVMDNRFKELRADGVGSNSKHTEILTKEEESCLWESGVLNTSTPLGLLRACVCIHCC